MLEAHPPVVDYVRRALLDPSGENLHLLDLLVDLTAREVNTLRKSGRASTRRRESTQIVAVLVRQMGEMLLAPWWMRCGIAWTTPMPSTSRDYGSPSRRADPKPGLARP